MPLISTFTPLFCLFESNEGGIFIFLLLWGRSCKQQIVQESDFYLVLGVGRAKGMIVYREFMESTGGRGYKRMKRWELEN